jgi:hypothetical protein
MVEGNEGHWSMAKPVAEDFPNLRLVTMKSWRARFRDQYQEFRKYINCDRPFLDKHGGPLNIPISRVQKENVIHSNIVLDFGCFFL